MSPRTRQETLNDRTTTMIALSFYLINFALLGGVIYLVLQWCYGG